MSGWYATSSTYNGEDTFFFARTVGTSNDVSTDKGLGKATELKPVVIGDLEWRHYYQPITIPSDYSSGIHLSGMWEVEQHIPTDIDIMQG